MNKHYLIIDQGGHGTRAMVFNSQGDIILSTHAPVTTTNPQPGWYEQDSADLVVSIKVCLEKLEPLFHNKLLHDKKLTINSAALITQRSSLVACYKDTLKPITPIISWQDTRNSDWLQQHIENGFFDLNELKKLTGLRLNAHYGASKMRWLLDHHPQVQEAAHQNNVIFLPLASYVTYLLTCSPTAVVDATSASRTLLCEFGQTQWSDTLLQLFSIQKNCLPRIVENRHDFGNLTLGHQQIPLQVVGGDQSFLPFAYGTMTFSNSLFINTGTGAFVQTPLDQQHTPSQLLCSFAAIDQEQHLSVAEGTVNACASALDWLFQQEQTTLNYDQLEEALKSIPSPPIFYHRITALGSPYWLPVGESSFSENASLAEKTVAVIESIVFLLAINVDLLQQAKPQLQQILISGGLSKSDWFCQKLASCTRLDVIRCIDHEASSRGAAFYLANITHYMALDSAPVFSLTEDRPLLARYQCFYEWLRKEWMKSAATYP